MTERENTSRGINKEVSQHVIFARSSFAATPAGAHEARHWGMDRVAQFASGEPVVDDIPHLRNGVWPQQDVPIALTLSELAGNVIRHAVPPTEEFTVYLSIVTQPPQRRGDLRISVSDARPDFGPRKVPTLSATNGRGLEVVEQVTVTAGHSPIKDGNRVVGKTVFAEVGPVQQAA